MIISIKFDINKNQYDKALTIQSYSNDTFSLVNCAHDGFLQSCHICLTALVHTMFILLSESKSCYIGKKYDKNKVKETA